MISVAGRGLTWVGQGSKATVMGRGWDNLGTSGPRVEDRGLKIEDGGATLLDPPSSILDSPSFILDFGCLEWGSGVAITVADPSIFLPGPPPTSMKGNSSWDISSA